MAVTWMSGWETNAVRIDGYPDTVPLAGTAAYSTGQARTGTYSIRCNPGSGASGYANVGLASSGWNHGGVYIASMPTVARLILGYGPRAKVQLNTDGTLSYIDTNGTTVGTSASALSTGQWYWIGWRGSPGTGVDCLQVNGVTVVTGSPAGSGGTNVYWGCVGSEASAIDIYIDDCIIDDAGFLPPSKVALLLPISDNARATLWTGGSGGTTNLWEAVNNCPPVGTATESDTTQIEHAGGAGGTTDAYDANMTTYTTAGVGSSDTILALAGFIVWGEDSATGAKLLSYSGASNPAWTGESSIDVSTGHGSGAVVTYSDTATDYWNERRSAIKTTGLAIGADITLGTSPVMRVVRPETASRVASVCFMGMYVAWTTLPPVNDYTTEVLADSPKGYWRLGEANGYPQDSSGNAHHVTSTGGSPDFSQAGAITGDSNTAVYFDEASSERFLVPDHADFDIGDGPFSVEFWVKRAATGAIEWCVGKFMTSGPPYGWGVGLAANGAVVGYDGASMWFTSSETPTNDTNWHHVVVTKNGSTRTAYCDGSALTNTASNYTLSDTNNSLALGAIGDYGSNSLTGTLDEVAFYGYVLDRWRVLAHYQASSKLSFRYLNRTYPQLLAH